MSWSSSLRPASFRGVSFGVLGAQKEFGRRVITHEFPLRDQPFHEDMGRHPRAFNIDAFLVGADVVARARRLEAALEQKGPGLLVHPYYGALTVVALQSATTFAAFEGRVARIQIAFEETGGAAMPGGVLNTVAALLSAGAVVASSVLEAAIAGFSLVRQLTHVRDVMAADFRASGSVIRSIVSSSGLTGGAVRLGPVVAPTGGLPLTIPAALDRLAATAANDLGDARADAELISRTMRALATVPMAVKSFSTERDEHVRLVDALLSVSGCLTERPGGRVEAHNRAVLTFLVDATAAAAAVEAASTVVWDSREQLDLYAARVAALIDDAADRAGAYGWDQPWRDLCDLGAAWSTHVAQSSPPLPRVRKLVLPAALPASLLAYQLDGDDLASVFGRGGSIARRNAVRHPGFVPGGEELEVVANG
ncbi:DNA circularization N-terminal domain-containing protein [Mesorhizobium sp. KR1-2]|uniref:DNA circularization protein n=1 Tax=Mesorhizobium sp. KR1-2 TaxID=3156609 RepID=UPI0032B6208B